MHLLHTFGVGGMEVGITKLVNGLDGARVTSTICSCCPGDSLKERLRPDVRLFELDRRPGNDIALVTKLYSLMRRERPHVLHTHRWATLCEGVIAARLAGVPFVVHGEHGTLETRPLNVRVQRWMWKRVDRVLSVSSRLAERMSRDVGFPLDRITVIRNGVDLDRFTPLKRGPARAALGIAAADLVIGSVGRLVAVKDQATLLRALAIVRDAGVTFRGVIAGTGPLRAELEGLRGQLGLSSVELLGNRNDVDTVLATFDVFVLSSVSEGLSNTIQEAMATGVPVVATRVGGADELVQENRTGLLVPSSDPQSMADAILRLARDRAARGAMGAAGRERAEAMFSIRGMMRGYEELYIDVVTSRASRYGTVNVSEA